MLITIITQLPESHERAVSLTSGKSADIAYQLACFAAARMLFEVLCGLSWGTLSWLLQWGGINLLRRSAVPKVLQRRGVLSPSVIWPVLPATVLIAVVEGLILGWPLAVANTDTVNFDISDAPFVMITDGSILIGSVGIVVAFVLPSLVAGCMATPKSEGLC